MIVKEKKGALKNVLLVLVHVFIAVNVFLFNVVLHEYGHFIAADYYGLEPKMEFNLNSFGDLGFSLLSFENRVVASTSFIDNGNAGHLMLVVLMGPFANLLLGVGFLICVLFLRNYLLRELCIIGGIVSLASFLMNVIPFSGSDGAFALGLI